MRYRIRNLTGQRIVISDLTVEDAYEMENWGVHRSPLFGDYNFDEMTRKDFRKWYAMKTDPKGNAYYSVRDNNVLVAYFGIKKISRFFRRSIFGIVVDASKLNEGYGTEILETFLPCYFGTFRMKRLELEVAVFNERARALYEKIGFREKERLYRPFYTDFVDFTEPGLERFQSSFCAFDGKLFSEVAVMDLQREDWMKK